ncbi:MAG: BolA family protein [Porticoccaceae bacterium]
MGPVEQVIRQKLEDQFAPAVLEVTNESYMHSVPAGSESHFKVVIVADKFQSMRAVQRHQLIYEALAEQLQQSVHALALHTYTHTEWKHSPQAAPASPDCMGGEKQP